LGLFSRDGMNMGDEGDEGSAMPLGVLGWLNSSPPSWGGSLCRIKASSPVRVTAVSPSAGGVGRKRRNRRSLRGTAVDSSRSTASSKNAWDDSFFCIGAVPSSDMPLTSTKISCASTSPV
jgi:hypothetical protein